MINLSINGSQGAQGAEGAQGLQGVEGSQGVQGAQGFQGNAGAQGAQGVQGVQGTQGAQGAQGNQGSQGSQGSQGAQGFQGVQGSGATIASGFVNAGTDVILGNLKVRMSSSGNRSLQVSTVSGTYSVYGSSVFSYSGVGGATIANNSPLSITTTPTYIQAGYTFATAGATDTWILMDTSSAIAWRITMIVGAGYNNNFISIERIS